jgi:plastocyanin
MNSRSIKTALAGVAFLGLALSVACGGYSAPTVSTPPPAGGGGGGSANATASIVNFSYSPNPVTVSVGQSVAWQNSDSVSHTATADNGSFNSGVIGPGATSAPMTMSTAGSFTYHCQIHPNMVATVNVQ